jgi:hypothetical protein
MYEMDEKEALEIIRNYCMNAEYYFAENDCFPKDYDENFHEALGVAMKALREVVKNKV